MPHARHRLDLHVLVQPPDRALSVASLEAVGVDEGWWDAQGQPAAASRLVEGGFAAVRPFDDPRPRLHANRAGGFRVSCPVQGDPIVRAFEAAMAAWRQGETRVLPVCPACGAAHALEDLAFAPQVAWGRSGVVLVDCGRGRLTTPGMEALQRAWGPLAVVGVRHG